MNTFWLKSAFCPFIYFFGRSKAINMIMYICFSASAPRRNHPVRVFIVRYWRDDSTLPPYTNLTSKNTKPAVGANQDIGTEGTVTTCIIKYIFVYCQVQGLTLSERERWAHERKKYPISNWQNVATVRKKSEKIKSGLKHETRFTRFTLGETTLRILLVLSVEIFKHKCNILYYKLWP